MAGPSILVLSRALCTASFDTIEQKITERAADCILDVLGAAVAGRQMNSTRAMMTTMTGHAGAGSASVWFSGQCCDPVSAATINAMAATALDVDDGHRKAAGHPGAAVVAAALATAEDQKASMAELLTATVIGYEAAVRVALARKAEHHTSTVSGRWSGVGAAAAAAWLMELPPEIMAQSILIAEQHAPRTSSAKHHGFAGSDVKEAIAWSVHTGLYAVDLARNGFSGYPDTFDQGILYDADILCSGLDRFDAIAGLFFKPYACCRWMHSAIDGLLEIIQQQSLSSSQIEGVTIRTFDQAVGLGNHVAPQSEAEAQFSIPFCLGVAAEHGPTALLPLDPELIGDSKAEAFARKVSVVAGDAMNAAFPIKAPAIVEVKTAKGDFSTQVDAAFGDPTNPMLRTDLQKKFRQLAKGHLSMDRIRHIEAGLDGIDHASAKPVRHVFADLHKE